MEEKLKTLKDLHKEAEKKYIFLNPDKKHNAYVDMFNLDLKAEAIKWVKDIDEQLKEFEHMQGQIVKNKFVNTVQGLIATREWIINFFNITSEDLK